MGSSLTNFLSPASKYMSKPSAPPPPDYAAIAQTQGQANKDTAQYNLNAGRATQVTPQGTSTWSLRPGADPNNPQAGDYIQTQTYAPAQQQLYDAQNAISKQYIDTAQTGLGRVGDALATPFSTAGLPALSSGSAGGPIQGQINTSGLPALSTDLTAKSKQVSDALLSRINPTLDQNEQANRTRLLNSGIEQGSAGWNNQSKLDSQARSDATIQAMLSGDTEARAQQAQELQTQGQLYGQAANNAQFANSAQGTGFSQGLANAQLSNAARQQGLSEESYLRSIPLNETNALRTGAQVAPLAFGGSQSGNAQSAPVFDAAQAQGAYNQSVYGNQQAGYNSTAGTLGQLATAAAMYYGMSGSDIRLKTNVRTIGLHPSGVRRVSWNWLDGSGSDFGVIAQELQSVRPDAVGLMPNGMLGVRYALIGGR